MGASRGFTPYEAHSTADQKAYETQRAVEAAEDVVRRQASAVVPERDTPPFTHLSVRSCWSLRDGAIRPRELAAAAAAAGMTHVGLTDRDGVYGAVRLAQACAAEGIVPVFGTDLALAPDQDRPGWQISRAGRRRVSSESHHGRVSAHTTDPRSSRPGRGPAWLEDDASRLQLIARDRHGWGTLCRAATAAHGVDVDERVEDRTEVSIEQRASPHLSVGALEEAADRGGLFALCGPGSPVGRLLADGQEHAAVTELRWLLDRFGRANVLLGVRHHLRKGDDDLVRRTLRLAEAAQVRAIAVNDVRYLCEDDAFLADVLTCVRNQVPLGRRHLGRQTAEGWFKTAAEMQAVFAERPDLLTAAHEVATECEVDLGLGNLHVPRLTGLSDEVAAGELHRRCWEGVAERFDRVTPRVRDRLERELDMVDRLGLHDYFLTVGDIMAAVRAELGILAACRGSAAGSLVCYVLRISDVDPVEHNLAFERFMNPYRDELPDIDVDVESARREDVYDLIIAKYGASRASCVAMVETFQARMAIREVGKVLGLPPDEVGHVAKSFTHARARDVRRALDALPELRGTNINAGQLDRLFDIVERIDGFPRHLALHPCGILMASLELQDVTPLERSARGYPMAQFDKDDVAALGLLKLDVLGVRMLSAMRHAMTLIPHTRGHELDVDDIPSGDRATYELICSARTVGMFQIESPGQQELVGRLRPEDFGDLITEISLFRPGPVKADMVTPFVNRHRGGEKPQYLHPALVPVLKETHGVVVYHEQVMGVISALTGCDMSYADLLRRQLNDDRRLPAMRAWAVARGVDRGFSREEAEYVWKQVASFASFGFCKAHAAAFAVPTYRSAYLKAHYLPELMAGILTHDPGMYPRRLILDDCRTFGVAILPVDINRSESHYTVEVIDRGQADRLLGIDREELPPGWIRTEDGELRPPSGFDAGDAGDGWRYAIRCGLQDVKGITAAEIDSVRDNRPFPSLEDVRVRANLSRPVAERLTDLGAFDHVAGLGRPGGPANRRQLRLAVEESWAAGERGRRRAKQGVKQRAERDLAGWVKQRAERDLAGWVKQRAERDLAGWVEQTTLDLHADHVAALPEPSGADQVRTEIAHSGLDVTRHVVSFYEPLLAALGVVRSSELEDIPAQRLVRVAGVKVAVQSPSQRSGQRVLFLSLDDRTGMTQVTFFERHLEDCAWPVLHSWLVVAEGRVTRRGQRGATVAGTRAWDLSRLWRAWHEGWLRDALAEKGTPAPHQRTPVRADGLQASQWGRGA